MRGRLAVGLLVTAGLALLAVANGHLVYVAVTSAARLRGTCEAGRGCARGLVQRREIGMLIEGAADRT